MIAIISFQRWVTPPEPQVVVLFICLNPLSEHHPSILRYVTLRCEAAKGGINAGKALYCARAARWQMLFLFFFFFPRQAVLLMLDATGFITSHAISLSDVPRQQRLTHQPHGTAVEEEVKMKFLDRRNSFFAAFRLPLPDYFISFTPSFFQDFYRRVVISIFEISFCIFHPLLFFLRFLICDVFYGRGGREVKVDFYSTVDPHPPHGSAAHSEAGRKGQRAHNEYPRFLHNSLHL